MKKLSINKDLIPYSFEIELNDKIYTMVVKYNERFDFFTIDVYLDDEIVMYGEKITLGEPLFLPVMYNDMPIIAPFDFAYNATRVTFENLDDTVELIFIPDDEVGAYDEVLG